MNTIMMNRDKIKPTLTQRIAREAASQVVDYDFEGNPITEADVMLMGAYGPIIERIVTLARTPLLEEIEKLKDQIVSVFDAEHPPTFRQGHPIHELEEVLKAETVTNMAKRITDLNVIIESQSRMMKYYSEYADMQSQEALKYQKRIRDLETQLTTSEIVCYQYRIFDQSVHKEGWTDWLNVQNCDLPIWQRRVLENPAMYELRPLFSGKPNMKLSVIRYRSHYPPGPADGTRRIGGWSYIDALSAESYAAPLDAADQVEFLYSIPKELPTFEEVWAEKEAQGYRYGEDALEQVKFGFELARRS
jgi:hypothetical protein